MEILKKFTRAFQEKIVNFPPLLNMGICMLLAVTDCCHELETPYNNILTNLIRNTTKI